MYSPIPKHVSKQSLQRGYTVIGMGIVYQRTVLAVGISASGPLVYCIVYHFTEWVNVKALLESGQKPSRGASKASKERERRSFAVPVVD